MILNEVLQKRGETIAQARALAETAAKENREMTSEETAKYEAMNAEISRLTKEKDRFEALSRLEAEQAQVSTPSLRPAVESNGSVADKRASKEYVEAFYAHARNSRQYSAILDSDAGSAGVLAPTVLEAEIVKKLQDASQIRSICTIRQSNTNVVIPVQASLPSASWGDENDAYTESDPTYGPVDLNAYKLRALTKVSEEILNDSIANLQAELSEGFGVSFAQGEEAAFLTGSGTGKPKGITLDAPVGVTLSGATLASLTADNLTDLFHSLKRAYRPGSSWVFSDSVVAAIRKLKTGTDRNQYMWQPGMQAGQPDLLFGRPVITSDFMPAIAASAVVGVFGNFSYYRIQDRVGIAIQRLNELYSEDGQVGFRMYKRLDGRCVLSEAFSALKLAAS